MGNKNEKNNEEQENYIGMGLTLGMCFGVAIGIAIGNFLNNIPICMCIGIGVGMCLGMGIGACIKSRKQEKDDEDE